MVITKEERRVRFYFDGAFKQELWTESGQNVASSDLFIGWNGSSGHGSGEQFFGGLDDIRIYSRAMPDAEIQTLYEFESKVTNAAPVILSQPVAASLYVGESAPLAVTAAGSLPLTSGEKMADRSANKPTRP